LLSELPLDSSHVNAGSSFSSGRSAGLSARFPSRSNQA
jgi:hypothetical protein